MAKNPNNTPTAKDTAPSDDMDFEIDMGSVFEAGDKLTNLHTLCKEYLASNEDPTLNEIEEKAIHGLIAYTAYKEGTHEEDIHAKIKDRFNVDHYQNLPRRFYDSTIYYLLDLSAEDIMH